LVTEKTEPGPKKEELKDRDLRFREHSMTKLTRRSQFDIPGMRSRDLRSSPGRGKKGEVSPKGRREDVTRGSRRIKGERRRPIKLNLWFRA